MMERVRGGVRVVVDSNVRRCECANEQWTVAERVQWTVAWGRSQKGDIVEDKFGGQQVRWMGGKREARARSRNTMVWRVTIVTWNDVLRQLPRQD